MQDLEHIAAFGAFFDFLENPSKYKKIVEDAAKETKEAKDVIEKQRKIKDVDKWRLSEEVRLNAISESLASREQSHTENLEKLAKEAEAHKSSVSAANKRMREREQGISEREDAVSKLEKERDKLKKLQQESTDERNKLQAERDHLKQQAERIKAATGGL